MNLSRRDLIRLGLVGAGSLAAVEALRVAGRLGLHPGPGAVEPPIAGRLLSAPGLGIVPRSGWGANESLRKQSPIFAPVRQIFVHHTVTGNGAPPVQAIQSVYGSHLAEGWIDIGYNFLVDAGGTVYEGRYSRPYGPGETPTGQNLAGMGVVGAHVFGHDVGSVGIAMLGTFLSVSPTGAALNSLMDLMAWLCDLYGLDPLGTTGGEPVIAGHRDANQTACPGDDCYNKLPALRTEVAQRIQANANVGTIAAPSCTLLVPGGITTDTTPMVTGQVSRSATGVNVTFTGSSSSHSASATASGGSFTITPSSYTLGLLALSADTYTVQAVATDGGGHTSPPTQVASGFQVVGSIGPALPTGYWVLASDGGVFAYGQASFLGSTGGQPLNAPVIGMEAIPGAAGDGYWLVAADGGIFAYGGAAFFGSTGGIRLNKPIVGITSSPTGRGYRLVASDGGIFSFGDAPFFGSTGGMKINQPIVGMAATPTGAGYWLVAADGGIFSFGDAVFYGSATGRGAGAPSAVAIVSSPSGHGYWIASANGQVFTYGDAPDHGDVVRSGVVDLDIAGMSASRTGGGYYLVNSSGKVYAFGDAPTFGDPVSGGYEVSIIGIVAQG
jgi:hypothetical protein